MLLQLLLVLLVERLRIVFLQAPDIARKAVIGMTRWAVIPGHVRAIVVTWTCSNIPSCCSLIDPNGSNVREGCHVRCCMQRHSKSPQSLAKRRGKSTATVLGCSGLYGRRCNCACLAKCMLYVYFVTSNRDPVRHYLLQGPRIYMYAPC